MNLSKRETADASITGINVTPLVDVTLVLLIVFLVTAKAVVSHSLELDLPPATNKTQTQTVLAIDVDASGSISVDGRRLTSDSELVHVAREARSRDADVRAVVHAAEATSHGAVVRVLDGLRTAKVTKIAFATRPRRND